MWTILGLLAWVAFFAGVSVHVSTFFPGGWTMAQAWPLHLLAIGFMFIAVFKCRSEGTQNTDFNRGPAPFRLLVAVMFLYALVNFFLFMGNVGNEQFKRDDKGQVMVRTTRGGPWAPSTEADMEKHERLVLRGFSGHWQVFFMAAALLLMYPPPRERG